VPLLGSLRLAYRLAWDWITLYLLLYYPISWDRSQLFFQPARTTRPADLTLSDLESGPLRPHITRVFDRAPCLVQCAVPLSGFWLERSLSTFNHTTLVLGVNPFFSHRASVQSGHRLLLLW
jgi:hypothetical protein